MARFKILGLFVACLLVFTGIALAEDKVIATDAPTTHHIGLYMGIDMGIFKKHGLDVEYLKQTSPADAVKAVSEGKADLLFNCPTATMLEISKGAPIKVIAQVKSPCTSILTVPANSPIKTIKDLKGKKVAGLSPTCEAVIAYVDAAKREDADFEIVKMSPKDAMAALEKGEVDACILEEPFASVMELKGNELKFREVVQVPCRFLSANVNFLKAKPDVAKRFVEALKEVNEIYEENPIADEIVEIAAKYTGASKDAIKHGMVRIHLTTDLNLVRIKALQDSLVRVGALKEPLKDEQLFAEELKGITW
jgi:NitT/TauT family transport system substrate-binding protein